jgi:hypothetical protein
LADASLARIARDTFVWFAPADEPINADLLTVLGAGAVRENQFGDEAPSGQAALRAGLSSVTWQRHLGRYIERGRNEAVDLGWVRRAFAEIAPSSRCIELTVDPFDAAYITGHPLREIRRLILNAARGRTGFVRLGTTEATVLAPGGQPTALLLVPPGASNSPTWRADAADLLRSAEVALSLNGRAQSPQMSGTPAPRR